MKPRPFHRRISVPLVRLGANIVIDKQAELVLLAQANVISDLERTLSIKRTRCQETGEMMLNKGYAIPVTPVCVRGGGKDMSG